MVKGTTKLEVVAYEDPKQQFAFSIDNGGPRVYHLAAESAEVC